MHLCPEARCLQGLLVAWFLQDPDALLPRVAPLGHQVHRWVGTQAGVLQQRARPRTQASPRSRGPGRSPDVRCISPAGKSRRAASVQERKPLGVGVPGAAPAWQGWGLMLGGSEQLGTLEGDGAPLPKLQSRGQLPAVCLLCYQKHQTQTLVLSPAACVSGARRLPSLGLRFSSVRR